MEKILPNNIFYDDLAADYDNMISFEKAVENKKKLLKNFITAEMKSAADIGCGSGVDSIALASSGLKVTSFDPSTEMLELAKINAFKKNVKVDFHNYATKNIPNEFDERFDLVVSLGNTFANIPVENFVDSLKRCCEILIPNGQLLIQVLNYEKIIADKQRIVNITQAADKYFIRFYDFLDEHIIFNILTFNKEKPSDNKLISTKVYPYLVKNFESGLEGAGFNSVQFSSNFQLTPFNNDQSKDLVVLAFKN